MQRPLWQRFASHMQHVLALSFAQPHQAPEGLPVPDAPSSASPLTAHERQHTEGLMRINHVGELCAQALYEAQGAWASNATLRAHYAQAGRDEVEHLHWTAYILTTLNGRPSLLNPLWYGGAYALGTLAGMCGDAWSLGFLGETEQQVSEHLEGHLQRLPEEAHLPRAVLQQMWADEQGHAQEAWSLGGRPLPGPITQLMRWSAAFMKTIAYRI